jgi:hypothetical protein
MVKLLPWVGGGLLFVSIVVGTFSDVPRPNPRLTIGGYEVLAADFHIHTFPLSFAVLSPWDTVTEARRNALDAIAITPHNHIWVAQLAQRLSRLAGDPIVLVGEEIHSTENGYHLLAVGVHDTISWRQPAGRAIEEIHRQGGIAIAAHPVAGYNRYDAEAMRKLDGAEVVHPIALRSASLADELRQFFSRAQLTAIGDSDYHLGPMSPQVGDIGSCRTYVFARDRSESGILDALRARRTIVYDREHVYGDPALIQLAAEDGRLPKLALAGHYQNSAGLFSGITGVVGLLAWVLVWRKN